MDFHRFACAPSQGAQKKLYIFPHAQALAAAELIPAAEACVKAAEARLAKIKTQAKIAQVIAAKRLKKPMVSRPPLHRGSRLLGAVSPSACFPPGRFFG